MVILLEFIGMRKFEDVSNLNVKLEVPFNFSGDKQMDVVSRDPFRSIIFPKLIFEHFGKHLGKYPVFECTDIIKANE